jgi:hypothetical protein
MGSLCGVPSRRGVYTRHTAFKEAKINTVTVFRRKVASQSAVFWMDRTMQEFDTTSEHADNASDKEAKAQALKQYLRLILKRVVAFVSFGPGVLAILWLLGRILKR